MHSRINVQILYNNYCILTTLILDRSESKFKIKYLNVIIYFCISCYCRYVVVLDAIVAWQKYQRSCTIDLYELSSLWVLYNISFKSKLCIWFLICVHISWIFELLDHSNNCARQHYSSSSHNIISLTLIIQARQVRHNTEWGRKMKGLFEFLVAVVFSSRRQRERHSFARIIKLKRSRAATVSFFTSKHPAHPSHPGTIIIIIRNTLLWKYFSLLRVNYYHQFVCEIRIMFL